MAATNGAAASGTATNGTATNGTTTNAVADVDELRVEVDRGVMVLTIDRPRRLNALNQATRDTMQAALEQAVTDGIGVVVITGAGTRSFSAGGDVKEYAASTPAQRLYSTDTGQALTDQLEAHPALIVCAIEGYCVGGGLELSLAADLRICGEDALLGLPEVPLGGVPSWGTTYRLPKVIGLGRAKEMIMFARHVDAATALRWGLIAEVVPTGQALSRAVEVAHAIADGTDAETNARAKRLISYSAFEGSHAARRHMEYLADASQTASAAFQERLIGSRTGAGHGG
ncbi:MAG: enoyl-CoA hydratase [Chloroflexota bacterium]|jgi:enoyl-CoA hydratase|nr:enoyl-CoA hydratase [Chloroflexota bacterium]